MSHGSSTRRTGCRRRRFSKPCERSIRRQGVRAGLLCLRRLRRHRSPRLSESRTRARRWRGSDAWRPRSRTLSTRTRARGRTTLRVRSSKRRPGLRTTSGSRSHSSPRLQR
eukprot:Amastigsp_a175122_138.p4 type:complete len:111 gc:universal Amastigsp_a175122_138:911-579(-)